MASVALRTGDAAEAGRAYTAGRRASIDSLLDDIDRVLASA